MSGMFEPVSIGVLSLKNRFVRSATCEAMADGKGGVTPALVKTYAYLAKGGVGLIISGHANVEKRGIGGPGQIGIYDDFLLPGLEELTRAVHAADGRIVVQLAHQGIWAVPVLSGMEPLGPSDSTAEGRTPARAVTRKEIEETIGSFADAALRAKKAGFDGVQIHAAHGFYLGAFLSSFYNNRKDAYGGPLENRARILVEVLDAIREKVGRDYPVLVKINADDYLEDGFTEADMLRVCTLLEAHGIDAIELSGGTMDPLGKHGPARPGRKGPEAWYAQSAQRLKETVNVPVILVGGIRSFATARNLVETGACDAVGLSRPLIRQPDLIRRWKRDHHEMPACLACNGCFQSAADGRGLRCILEERKRDRSA
ncbi:NADH oxidase [Pseudodesulfovibrio hydrargyri]|uniref:NADH oxidase n=1 Tax=Pseudodesulfovibrio hydrargyri TaxID=2125990 RepID=A0A1J5MQQ4_9BACT|nr:NADH:flavin oxidoreductase [Pseudodesulfovibrio hydrargyri]OIQ48942.1 NADH oxidase [Pseudodesulfovibrio hydrargyri]